MRRPSARSVLAVALAGAVLVGLAAAPSSAAGDVYRGAGTVTKVDDGDTIVVGSTRIRLANLQAPDANANSPMPVTECGYSAATAAMTRLTLGKKVQYRSERASSSSLGRPLRSIYVYNPTTRTYSNVGTSLAQQGLVVWQYFTGEHVHDAAYQTFTERAAAAGKGLFRTTACGSGPQQSVPIRMWAKWDADGVDSANLNGEYAVIENRSTTDTLFLGGWWLRTAGHAYYRIPSGTSIKPGSWLTVHVGKGTNRTGHLYWGSSTSLLTNPLTSTTGGGSVYLLDPQSDMRAWAMWPCRTCGTDPLAGKVVISSVNYDAPGDDLANPNGESITLTNRSSSRVSLGGYYIRKGANTYTFYRYDFLDPGASFTLRMGKGTSTDRTGYWGFAQGVLPNSAYAVQFENWNGKRLQCVKWGSGTC